MRSTGRLFHSIELVQRRRTLAWQVLCTFSERSAAACWKVWESVMRRGHSAVNSGTAARTSDEPWTSKWRLCNRCARGLAASVTTATETWHWFCCCSASRHGPAYLDCAAVCRVTHQRTHQQTWRIAIPPGGGRNKTTHTCFLMISKRLNARRVSKVPDLHRCITAGRCQLWTTTACNKQLSEQCCWQFC